MGKDSAGEKRVQKISEQIAEKQAELQKIQDLIDGFKPEYDEKKTKLDVLQQEIEETEKNKEELISQFRKEAESSIDTAYNEKKEQADTILDEAQRKNTEADEKLTTANTQADKILKEANEHKEKIDKDLKQRIEAVSKREDACKICEDAQLKTAEEQAELKSKLDRLKIQADLGFQTELSKEREPFDQEISKLKGEIADLGKQLIAGKTNIDNELKQYKEDLLKSIDIELQSQRDEISKARDEILNDKTEVAKAKADAESELQAVKTSRTAYEKKYTEIDEIVNKRLQDEYQNVLDDRDSFRNRCNELAKESSDKTKTIIQLTTKLKEANGSEISALNAEISELRKRIETLTADENSFIGKLKEHHVDSATLVQSLYKLDEYDNLLKEYGILVRDKQDLERKLQEARISEEDVELANNRANQYQSNYESAIEELERLKKPSRKDRLSGFTSFTDFDSLASLPSFGATLTEITWLMNIKTKMDEAGIKISKKLLYAFHTSVKIHDWSPLVVLAGVSGTGKSELPRQYAHHGGMNFISVPVKPDWDSMQSLFGYYNSIENKFEPTELSRAIYYMQSDSMKDTMLMVLLDEMNLAYVELYFSDLLSKYETKRGTDDVITYDINLGANEVPEKMIIDNNILWVGTMNEDETTKALSDKVVDRSTLLTFPRPKVLVSRRSDIKIADAEKKLSKKMWERWCSITLTENDVKSKIQIDEYRKIIEDINDLMSKVNRNLGHRVWQSIELYVFSHPMTIVNKDNGAEFKRQFDSAFAEAVAFKVMPKLRGIEVSGDSKKVLEAIGNIIDREVHSLYDDYKQAMGLSSRIFQWCSAKFMDIDEEGNK